MPKKRKARDREKALGWAIWAMRAVVSATTEAPMADIYLKGEPDGLRVIHGEDVGGTQIALAGHPAYRPDTFEEWWASFVETDLHPLSDDEARAKMRQFPVEDWTIQLHEKLRRGKKGLLLRWKQDVVPCLRS